MNITRDGIVEGLKAGRTLVVDRRDSPALPICLNLQVEGLVTQEFVQYDEQSSAVKFRWKDEADELSEDDAALLAMYEEPAPIPKLADRECEHGKLPTDRVQTCDCWTAERA